MAVRSPLALLVALSLATTPVLASPASDAIRDGKEALTLRRYDEAAAIFTRGLEVAEVEEERWQMLLGLALAHELGGDLAAAASHYHAFLASSLDHPAAASGRWAERRQSAERDLAELEPRLLEARARVELRSEPPGAAVAIEGEPSMPGPVRYLPEGQHTVELSLEEHLPLLVVVSVEAGQRVTIERALVPRPPAPAPEPLPPAVVPPPPERPAPEPVLVSEPPVVVDVALEPLGWSLVGVGAAGLAVGIGLSAAAVSTGDELTELQEGPVDDAALARDAALRARLAKLQSGAAALYAGGGALVVAGALVVLLETTSEPASARVIPLVGPGFVGLRAAF